MEENNNIFWYSTPVYDECDFWFYDNPYWNCLEWKIWFEKLEDHYGLDQAVEIWSLAWGKQASYLCANPFFVCKYDKEFSDFFLSKGIDVGHILSSIINKTKGVLDDV